MDAVNGSRDTVKFCYLWPLCIYEFKLSMWCRYSCFPHISQHSQTNSETYQRKRERNKFFSSIYSSIPFMLNFSFDFDIGFLRFRLCNRNWAVNWKIFSFMFNLLSFIVTVQPNWEEKSCRFRLDAGTCAQCIQKVYENTWVWGKF